MRVYLNGRIIDADRARVPHDDAGFQHGVGLFETMTACHGRAFRLDAHLDRLFESAETLGMKTRSTRDELAGAVTSTLKANDLQAARIRLTVTPGRLNLLHRNSADTTSQTVLVVATPPTTYDPAYFEAGVTVTVAGTAANPMDPFAGHKTLAYWHRLHTLRQAADLGAAEAIWLNVSNHLASGAVSNLFLIRDGALLTPPARGEEARGALASPVLPGVTRRAVCDMAPAIGVQVQRRMLNINDLLDADEVFLTNSNWLVLPVTQVERKAIGPGNVGPITHRIRTSLIDQVQQECAP